MVPATSRNLLSLDLNEDQNHDDDPFTPNHQLVSSFSSLSYPNPFNKPQDHQGSSYFREQPKHLPSDEQAEKIIPSSRSSWDHFSASSIEAVEDGSCSSSVKWMPSKKRMIRKMITSSDQRGTCSSSSSYIEGKGNSVHNYFEDQQQQQPLSPHISNNSITVTVRVCSDCHTTKTPLWRSGPCGPKSLCNACGIRQRKARRAAAMAAAAANASINMVAGDETSVKGGNKDNKSKIMECTAPKLKKKRKLIGVGSKQSHQGRKNKLGFDEDLTLRLSKNFPHQDEIKEAAILLMALSYGLVHG